MEHPRCSLVVDNLNHQADVASFGREMLGTSDSMEHV